MRTGIFFVLLLVFAGACRAEESVLQELRIGDHAARVELALTANSTASEARLRERIGDLRNQFEASGLRLVQAQVQHGEIAE